MDEVFNESGCNVDMMNEPPRKKSKSMKLGVSNGKGVSCHQCKSRKDKNALCSCSNHFEMKLTDNRRQCHKKYCFTCMLRYYKEAYTMPPEKFLCPCCRNKCVCASCLKRSPYEKLGPPGDENNQVVESAELFSSFSSIMPPSLYESLPNLSVISSNSGLSHNKFLQTIKNPPPVALPPLDTMSLVSPNNVLRALPHEEASPYAPVNFAQSPADSLIDTQVSNFSKITTSNVHSPLNSMSPWMNFRNTPPFKFSPKVQAGVSPNLMNRPRIASLGSSKNPFLALSHSAIVSPSKAVKNQLSLSKFLSSVTES